MHNGPRQRRRCPLAPSASGPPAPSLSCPHHLKVDKLLGSGDPTLVACAFRKQRFYLFTWVRWCRVTLGYTMVQGYIGGTRPAPSGHRLEDRPNPRARRGARRAAECRAWPAGRTLPMKSAYAPALEDGCMC